jgi:5-methylcytosine-specific restriction endonuclease McrA
MKARRSLVPVISLLAGVIPWARYGEPGHLYGLGASVLLTLLLLPLGLLFVVFGVPYFTAGLFPREQRAKFRHWRAHRIWPKPVLRSQQRSSRIPKWLEYAVKTADRWQCQGVVALTDKRGNVVGYERCCRTQSLQIDHVIPWSLGGLTALFNLVTLCDVCNRTKSNYFERRNGTICYNPFPGLDRQHIAAEILQSERRRRMSPLRWVLAAHSLGWI